MITLPKYSKEEFARRGDQIYAQTVAPTLTAEDAGKFVVIDIETGAFELDAEEIVASDRLLARLPDAQVWLARVGSRYARRFSGLTYRNSAGQNNKHILQKQTRYMSLSDIQGACDVYSH